MKRVLMCATLVFTMACSAMAADGVPSQAKLSKLGLGSMELQSDQAGIQVRGRGFGLLKVNFFVLAGTALTGGRGGSMMGLDFITGPPPTVVVGNQPTFGTLGTIDPNTNINVPFTANYSQITGGSVLQITGSVWGQVSGGTN